MANMLERIQSARNWVRGHPLATAALTALSFLFIFLPQWASAVWSLFSSDPLVPSVLKTLNIQIQTWSFSLSWITTPIGAVVLFGITYLVLTRNSNVEQSMNTSVIAPNIICKGEDDLFVELDRHEVFRESEYSDEGALRADVVKFINEPKPGHKVASVDNVRAQIIFYRFDWPEREHYHVDYACWLNEESPFVSFNLSDNAIHYLIIGIIQNKIDGSDGFEHKFTIYGNSPDRNAPLSRYVIHHSERYNVKVRLIVGEHGEFSSDHDFELEIDPQSESFSFQYITAKDRQQRKESAQRELIKLINEGEAFVTIPLINPDWDELYAAIHEWIARVSKWLDRHFGLSVSHRFTSVGELMPYPHKISDGYRRFFDELYTRIEHLKDIARDEGAAVPPSNISQQIQAVAVKRREQILKDLAEFAARLNTLLDHTKVKRLSIHERDLYVWDGEIFDYLTNYLDKADTTLISDNHLEEYTPPEDIPILRDTFFKRAYSRLVRLNRLIDEIQSGRRPV